MLTKTTVLLLLGLPAAVLAQTPAAQSREKYSLDANWRFALGHPSDTEQDFANGTSYFSYLAKAGYGDGAASPKFDDRAWRLLDLPHDWAVELPFDSTAAHSHGYKAIGRGFPATSVGWYRKTFTVPAADLGRKLTLEFDGVYRNSKVWLNGHYLGNEASGYNGFRYDISDYLNYGGPNVVAVRADATLPAFTQRDYKNLAAAYRHRGSFELPADFAGAEVTFFYNSIGKEQRIYINGRELATDLKESATGNVFRLAPAMLKPGRNTLEILATPLTKAHDWDVVNTSPGTIQVLTKAGAWQRKAFNGLAQIIIQTTQEPGEITLTASAKGMKTGVLKVKSGKVVGRLAMP